MVDGPLDPYVTLEDLADYMEVDEMPLFSAQLSIDAAMSAVREYIGQDITFVANDEELHDGRGLRRLRLRQRPVRDVVEVWVDDIQLEDTSFAIDGAFLDRTDDDVWCYGLKNVLVVYDHGWDVPESGPDIWPVPADIRLVTLALAKRQMDATSQGDLTLTGETIGSYSYSRDPSALTNSGSLLQAEIAVLDRYAVRLIP